MVEALYDFIWILEHGLNVFIKAVFLLILLTLLGKGGKWL
jgi:hypothetical protein